MNVTVSELNTQQKVCCTDKCHKALLDDSQLKGRERQFCLLLSRGDEMSQLVSQQLRKKVNLDYLLNEGYVELMSDSEYSQLTSGNAILNDDLADSSQKKYADVPTLNSIRESLDLRVSTISNENTSLENKLGTCTQSHRESKKSLKNDNEVGPMLRFLAGNM